MFESASRKLGLEKAVMAAAVSSERDDDSVEVKRFKTICSYCLVNCIKDGVFSVLNQRNLLL